MSFGHPGWGDAGDDGRPTAEDAAAELRAWATTLSRQRRRVWSAVLTLSAEMIAAGRRSPDLADELRLLAAACEARGRDPLAWVLQRAIEAVA